MSGETSRVLVVVGAVLLIIAALTSSTISIVALCLGGILVLGALVAFLRR